MNGTKPVSVVAFRMWGSRDTTMSLHPHLGVWWLQHSPPPPPCVCSFLPVPLCPGLFIPKAQILDLCAPHPCRWPALGCVSLGASVPTVGWGTP